MACDGEIQVTCVGHEKRALSHGDPLRGCVGSTLEMHLMRDPSGVRAWRRSMASGGENGVHRIDCVGVGLCSTLHADVSVCNGGVNGGVEGM